MADYKLLGKNYQTPDLYAKVTGRARYAEDHRVEGMVFCKLLVSPMPHARVRSIDSSAAATPKTSAPSLLAIPRILLSERCDIFSLGGKHAACIHLGARALFRL